MVDHKVYFSAFGCKEQQFIERYWIMETKNTKPEIQLLTAKQLGSLLSLSKRQIFRLNSCGKIPAPIRIGGSVRWAESTITKWLALGAPDRRTFDTMQGDEMPWPAKEKHRSPKGGQKCPAYTGIAMTKRGAARAARLQCERSALNVVAGKSKRFISAPT